MFLSWASFQSQSIIWGQRYKHILLYYCIDSGINGKKLEKIKVSSFNVSDNQKDFCIKLKSSLNVKKIVYLSLVLLLIKLMVLSWASFQSQSIIWEQRYKHISLYYYIDSGINSKKLEKIKFSSFNGNDNEKLFCIKLKSGISIIKICFIVTDTGTY